MVGDWVATTAAESIHRRAEILKRVETTVVTSTALLPPPVVRAPRSASGWGEPLPRGPARFAPSLGLRRHAPWMVLTAIVIATAVALVSHPGPRPGARSPAPAAPRPLAATAPAPATPALERPVEPTPERSIPDRPLPVPDRRPDPTRVAPREAGHSRPKTRPAPPASTVRRPPPPPHPDVARPAPSVSVARPATAPSVSVPPAPVRRGEGQGEAPASTPAEPARKRIRLLEENRAPIIQ